MEAPIVGAIPSINYCITSKCNLRCEYCPPYGENLENVTEPLETDDVIRILEISLKLGVTTVRITGGEPLLIPEKTMTILRRAAKINGIDNLRLNTNGVLLSRYVDELKNIPFAALKVSLDTVNRSVFKDITGEDKLDDVLEGILQAKDTGLPVGINTVLIKKVKDEIWGLIDFCDRNNLDLKILDLVQFEEPGYEYFKANFISASGIGNELREKYGKPEVEWLSSRRGVPQQKFLTGNISIVVKDGDIGSTFIPVCKKCDLYPCREGILCLTLTADGNLYICKVGLKEMSVNLGSYIKWGEWENIEKEIKRILDLFDGSYFLQKKEIDFSLE